MMTFVSILILEGSNAFQEPVLELEVDRHLQLREDWQYVSEELATAPQERKVVCPGLPLEPLLWEFIPEEELN